MSCSQFGAQRRDAHLPKDAHRMCELTLVGLHELMGWRSRRDGQGECLPPARREKWLAASSGGSRMTFLFSPWIGDCVGEPPSLYEPAREVETLLFKRRFGEIAAEIA
jgi:hypothetical protein